MDELFDLIRSEASAQTWSSGVRLVREEAVVLRRQGDNDWELSVVVSPAQRPALVNLYPDDEDWSCSCSSTDNVCHHVAASIIALRHAKNAPLRRADAERRIEYRIIVEGKNVGLLRELVSGDGARESLTQSIKAYPDILLGDGDLEVDAILAGRSKTTPPRHLLARLLHHLGDRTVNLGSSPVKLGKPEAGVIAVVEECAEGFRLRLEQSKSVKQIFANGALLRRNKGDAIDSLHPIAEHKLPGHLLREAERGIIVPHNELADLTSRLIPMFERTLHVERRAAAVKRAKRMRPRIAVELRSKGKHSEVLATLVYGDPPVARIDGDRLHVLKGTTPPLRDAAAESALRTRMGTELHLVPGQALPLNASEAVDLGTRLRQTTMPVIGAEKFSDLGELEPELEFNGELLTRFTVRGKSAAGAAVIEAWFGGDDYVPLLGGGFGRLPHGWLARHGHQLADLLAASAVEGKLPAASKTAVAELFEEIGAALPPGLATLTQTLSERPDAPADLRANLRNYQRDGISWLLSLKQAKLGGILADDMGLGKTLQAICALDQPSLVVAPTSVIGNWEREIARFRPTLRVERYHGTNRKLHSDSDVTVTSYAILRRDIEKLAAISWSVVVLDEAQAIKNPESQATQATMRLKAEFRVTMSGTPVENRLEELWSQMNFANPGLLGSRSYFQKRYAAPITEGNDAARGLLQRRLKPFVLRRLKRDVAPELPPRTDTLIVCELSHEERATYDAVRAATKEDIVKKLNAGASVMAALEALLRLRQAACDPALLPGQYAESSSKIDALLAALDSALVEGHKALVFSQWTSLLDRVESKLMGQGYRYLRLDGESRDRQALVDSFQDPNGPSLMLISLKAGGTGLNLTAADHVFLLDPWWNPAVEDQAADRAHRIGQERPVFVHRLVSRDTVEEKILELQERKRGLAEAAVGGELAGSPLGREDILALFD